MSKQINLPIGWCLSNIEEICFLKARIGWQGLRSDEFLDYGYFCLITGTDIIEGEINWADTHYITSERYNQDKTIQLRIGDILITKDGTIGKVGYVDTLPKPATLNSGVYVVRSKDEKSILNQYLARFFKSLFFENFIGELKAGSTISHLYQKDFVHLDIVYPQNSEEQRRIAKALNDVDKLIREFDTLIEKKRSIMQGTMQDLLTARRRLPGYSEPWIDTILGKVSIPTMGQSPSSLYYNHNGKGLPLIQGNADIVNRCSIIRTYSSEYTKTCAKGDIIMSVRAPVGEVAIASYDSCIGRGVCAFTRNLFLYYMLMYNEDRWSAISTGSTFDSVNGIQINNFLMYIPSSEAEQNAIASVLSDMDVEIEEVEAKRDKYIAVRQGMMQQLLTGKIRLI